MTRPAASTSCWPEARPDVPEAESLFLKNTAGLASAQAKALLARVASAVARVVKSVFVTLANTLAPAAKAAADASVPEVFAVPYTVCPVAAEGGVAEASPTTESKLPSSLCRRAKYSRPQRASSRMSDTPLPDSGMPKSSPKATGFSS